MFRRPILAALAAGALALTGLATSSPAQAAEASTSWESCTLTLPAGSVHVVAQFVRSGLTKTGHVSITGASGPVLLVTDRVGYERGVGGMVPPGRVRSWSARFPIGFYTHAHVAARDSSGTVRSCGTR